MKFGSVSLGILSLFVIAFAIGASPESAGERKLNVAIAGMVHGHVNGWLKSEYQDELELVGIWETKAEVFRGYSRRYELEESLLFANLERMLDERNPEAVWVFSSTYDHAKVVEACAPRGIHVILEKPLAVDLGSATRMAKLARQYDIHLLTNLETSWYSSLQEAMEIAVDDLALGELTKVVSHFGHTGPKEIRCPPEFLEWLTDPVLNGGGASADFGCYGANIITHIMGNQRPLSVSAVFQSHKPDLYPGVDDDATIILEYPGVQGIIQASWDWPYSRKDVHIYGRSGVVRTLDQKMYDIRLDGRKLPVVKEAVKASDLMVDPVKYFAAVIRGELDPSQGLSSLETNIIAVEIIDAAKKSARTGKSIRLKASL